jgi:thiol-disulfide isomerase/thioredoxin
MENKYSVLPPGIYRAVLQLTPSTVTLNPKGAPLPEKMGLKFEEATQGELPFLFEVKYTDDKHFYIEIINGEERIKVESEDITHGRNRSTGKDTLLIKFPVFGSMIRAIYRERVIEGEWVVPAKNLSIPFVARYGQNHRFTNLNKSPTADLTGKWDCTFDLNEEKPYKAIGELRQNGNILRGTFRTETGDYRYLDGEVQGNKFYLSCFDGSHAFLFEGKIRADGQLDGAFRSSKNEPEVWEGKRNETAALTNALELSKAKTEGSIQFSFPNAEGKTVALSDYGTKVKILQVMGTWCPNCWDETKFLVNYLKNNPQAADKVAVIPLAFERNADIAATQVATYRRKMNLPYDILIAGTSTKKEEAAKTLPFITGVVAFPTMVFVDKQNRVRRVHTGFDGPATSQYAHFEKEFDEFLKKLMSE